MHAFFLPYALALMPVGEYMGLLAGVWGAYRSGLGQFIVSHSRDRFFFNHTGVPQCKSMYLEVGERLCGM